MNKIKLIPSKYRYPLDGCRACGLCNSRKHICFGSGPGKKSKLILCGEAPGKDENESGIVFCGRAGGFLNKVLLMLKTDRNDINILNICKCRPPDNRAPTDIEIKKCLPNLRKQIALLKPTIIVALGKVALYGLTGIDTVSVKKCHGELFDYRYNKDIPVLFTFHPAFILRPFGAEHKVDFMRDIKTALVKAGLR